MMRPVLEVLQSSAEYLQRHGVESARLNAEHLIAHVLGKKKRIDLYLEFDRPLGAAELDPLRDLMRRRARGEPLQHLLGTVEFHGRIFAVDRRALIPRPETEELVERLLKLELPAGARCVDVGTGSGVIALTLAAERPACEVHGADISPAALRLARENAGTLGLGARVRFAESDLLAGVEGEFDLVAANLPYVARGEMEGLSREVRHDPPTALDGGEDGLVFIGRLVGEARARMKPGGHLALEIGHDQARRVECLLAGGGFTQIQAHRDLQGVERFVFARVDCAGDDAAGLL